MEVNTTSRATDTSQSQLNKYVAELEEGLRVTTGSLVFWSQRGSSYSLDLAQDLIAAPASQAFVERIFSVCGILVQGC